jgi:Glycosyltransferase sugar-binding region containing DXD motif/Alpha 1,4-glycosyltransferase conserved region
MQRQFRILKHKSSHGNWWIHKFYHLLMSYKYSIPTAALMLGTMVLFFSTARKFDSIGIRQRQQPFGIIETNMKVSPMAKEQATSSGQLVFHIIFTVKNFSTLNSRCIESIFFFHPDAQLKLHSNADNGIHATGDSLPAAIQLLIDRGYQIDIVPYRLLDVLQTAVRTKNSIIQASAAELWSSQVETKWKHEKFWYANESDLLRFCILYTEGGIYIDTDVVLVRPLAVLDKTSDPYDGLKLDNVLAREGTSFHSAVMKFTQAGNTFLGTAINNFLDNYNGKVWAYNGPLVLKRVSEEYPELVCNDVSDTALSTVSTPCSMQPVPEHSFQPVNLHRWAKHCLEADVSPIGDAAQRIVTEPGVYAVHFNNKIMGATLEAKSYLKGTVCDFVLTNFCVLCL